MAPQKPFPAMSGLNRTLAMLAFPPAALLVSAGALQAQEERAPLEALLAPVAEVVADTIRPSITLDSVRLARRSGGVCGQPVPMPEAKPRSDSVEMPRAAPSPRILPIPTIRCDLTRTVQGSQPALRLGPAEGTASADSVTPPDPE
jgi:hypothetical protein